MSERIGQLLEEPRVFDPNTPFARAARQMPRDYEHESWRAGFSFREMVDMYSRGARRNPLTGRVYWVSQDGRVRSKETSHV